MSTWGTLSWSVGDFGEQNNSTVSLTGISLSSNLGTTTQTATVDFGWSNNPWGIVSWGNNDVNAVAEPTGFALTNDLGDETTVGEINTGWGRDTWGEDAWGIAQDVLLSGFSLTANLGSVATQANANTNITGELLSSNLGSVNIEATSDAVPTSLQATLNLGTLTITADASLDLSGIAMSANLGTLNGFNAEGWGRYGWGIFDWGVAGEWESVELTGVELSATVDTEGAPTFTALADAQISNTQSKFGGTSLKLDGTADRIQSTDITLGTGNYTWETFAYFNSLSSTQCIWDAGENVGASQNPVVYITPTNLQLSYAGGTYINAAHGMSTGQWHHIAIVRNGTQLQAFIDGTSIGTATYALGSGATNHVLGGNFAGTFTMDGFLDESRLTNTAVYTSNFTPPTSPFETSGNDIWLLHYDEANGSTVIFNAANARTVVTGDGSLTLTGIGMTAEEGILDPTPDVILSGVSLTANLGTIVAIIDVDVAITGQAITANLGDETIDLNTPVDVTGIELTGATGDTNETGEGTVLLTGNNLTSTLASANVLVWNEVPTGTDVTYSDVNTGTTVTWTDVDTAA